MATQGSPDHQESTAKQNSAVCITGVNKIAPNFITLVVTYIYVVRLFNPFEHSVVCDATGLAKSVQYAVICETVETSMSFACNSSFLAVDGMTCLIQFES